MYSCFTNQFPYAEILAIEFNTQKPNSGIDTRNHMGRWWRGWGKSQRRSKEKKNGQITG